LFISTQMKVNILMKYRMYVDEVGNPDLESSKNPIHRFLSLTGLIINLDYVSKSLHPEMESIKSKYFDYHPDDPVIFHRKEMVNAKYPFQALKDHTTRNEFKEDKRLKASFAKLWEEGTEYVGPERFKSVLTSKQLKVKPKVNNISGLQLADLIAHPSRNEILMENSLLDGKIGPFAEGVIAILQDKYYRHAGKIYGKKFI
jgi:hypothetical protein